ncbi:MAG: hypothetical protein FJ091_14390 [Deltaproteobacteria bacterium]|nr:hypothetical protein [Deltaproteobacteria bacterium]
MSASTQEDWLRKDLTHTEERPLRSLPLLPIAIGVFAAYVGLVALRGEIQRLERGVGEAMRTEQALRGRASAATAELEALRSPSRLREFAAQQGFVVPERVIPLRDEAVRP